MYKVKIAREMWSNSLGIAIFEERAPGEKRRRFKPIKLEIEQYEEGVVIENPTIRLSEDLAIPFIKALSEAFSGYGIKTESDDRRDGKLEAQSAHLQDMRRLVFSDFSEKAKEATDES